MNESVFARASLTALALLALLSLFVAPWAAISRETGARGTVLVLPNRVYDFTGRTDPVQVPLQSVVLGVSALALAAIAAGSGLRERRRNDLWLGAGAVLVATVVWGSVSVGQTTRGAQYAALLARP